MEIAHNVGEEPKEKKRREESREATTQKEKGEGETKKEKCLGEELKPRLLCAAPNHPRCLTTRPTGLLKQDLNELIAYGLGIGCGGSSTCFSDHMGYQVW